MEKNRELKFDVFIKGEKVDLIVMTKQIAEKTNWYLWFNDQETTMHIQKHYYPNTIEEQLIFFKNSLADKTKIVLGIVQKKRQFSNSWTFDL